MPRDHDMLWCRCARLGPVLLPLVDQEPWRQARRRENLQAWGIDTAAGERLIEIFAAWRPMLSQLTLHYPPAELDDVSLRARHRILRVGAGRAWLV